MKVSGSHFGLPALAIGDVEPGDHEDGRTRDGPAIREVAKEKVAEHRRPDDLGVGEGCEKRGCRELE